MKTQAYGEAGPIVIVLHGGPAAVGEAAPIARRLSTLFRTIEPYQRGSGNEPLTVSRHVEDLHQLIQSIQNDSKPSIVGESWGAMLALAYASTYPDTTAALVLIGCGTFDKASRARMNETIESRKNNQLRERLYSLVVEYPDISERLQAEHRLTEKIYDYDAQTTNEQLKYVEPFDQRAYVETWRDMLKLQENGIYPAAFSTIRAPALMLHGAYDPHPGQMIYRSLKPHMPQLEYHEFENCGHSLWKEKQAADEFFKVMASWLLSHGRKI
jgi:pimeloyl-ACP methyl ester carboxylesterase